MLSVSFTYVFYTLSYFLGFFLSYGKIKNDFFFTLGLIDRKISKTSLTIEPLKKKESRDLIESIIAKEEVINISLSWERDYKRTVIQYFI